MSTSNELSFIFTEKGFRVDEGDEIELSPAMKTWKERFEADRWQALYDLGFQEKGEGSPSFSFLYRLASSFDHVLLTSPLFPFLKGKLEVSLPEEEKKSLLSALPYGLGMEWVDGNWLSLAEGKLNEAFHRDFHHFDGTVEAYISSKKKGVSLPDRIYFHLVENRSDEIYPFAFLATYATFDREGRARQMPLYYALEEYKKDREKLIRLLSSLNKAADIMPRLSDFVEDGTILHPFGVTAEEAWHFLKAVPLLEEKGIYCRIPNWWKKGRSRPSISVSLGGSAAEPLGLDTILSLRPELSVDGVKLTMADVHRLMKETEGLSFIKGKWVEVDHDRLAKLLGKMEKLGGAVTFRDALQMEGKETGGDVSYVPGTWLSQMLRMMKNPSSIGRISLPKTFKASLRPYQMEGFKWLCTLSKLGFGMCLADDMGLGKTVQVLAYLEKMRTENPTARCLLIVPASLLGNWEKEISRFAPSLSYTLLHGQKAEEMKAKAARPETFLTMTTYGMAQRLEELKTVDWDAEILDEAQNIKNPNTRQTRAVKAIRAACRLAMTGTPVENNLLNLWSLFDFLNPGLLGSRMHFLRFVKGLSGEERGYEPLRKMTGPFVLRRLKTDKSIISDLPDKLEMVEYVPLSVKQTALYRGELERLSKMLKEEKNGGIRRKGLVLTALAKLKQICNHPDEFLGQDRFKPEDSGKFIRLREICETLHERREPVLIFTQYREMTEPLSRFLTAVFGRPGLIIHGGTPVKKRMELVDRFNGEDYIPFMILSLKAAGTGLNLTKASTVIHFDRWWNPAVEDQATDRAYRIGQKKNVMVYKFVSQGTVEEKINDMIEDKKKLAREAVGSGEAWITELSDKELMDLMKLDSGEGDDES